jgi:hypothetical protein
MSNPVVPNERAEGYRCSHIAEAPKKVIAKKCTVELEFFQALLEIITLEVDARFMFDLINIQNNSRSEIRPQIVS